MPGQLIAEEGRDTPFIISLENSNEWVIGTDPEESEIILDDPLLSSSHLLCQETPEGIQIQNLSEDHPVKLNGEELTEPHLLHDGDVVTLGETNYRFSSQVTHPHPSEEPLEELTTNQKNENGEKENTIFEDEENLEVPAEVTIDLTETSRWLLKVIGGPNHGAEFSMQPETTYVIGTDPTSCDIILQDVSVSRQHARLTVNEEGMITIEDLNSRNGTLIEGTAIQGQATLQANALVSLGTTTFVVFDREGKRDTLISPLLPAIYKVLQQNEEKKTEESTARSEEKKEALQKERELEEEKKRKEAEEKALQSQEKSRATFIKLIFLLIFTAIVGMVGLGVYQLFRTEEIEHPKIDIDKELNLALTPYPSVKSSFNKTTGRLVLIGHLLRPVDRNQLLYTVQALPFVTSVNDNIVIDEYIWQETNQILSENPAWKGINLQSPQPGQFVLTGYLKSQLQLEELHDYMAKHFPYLDRLEIKVVVEQRIVSEIEDLLAEKSLRDVHIKMENGEVALTGDIPFGHRGDLANIIEKIRKIPGVRSVKNFVNELETEEAVVNISNKYQVTGSSIQAGGMSTVFINGRILSINDTLDGMKIIDITPSKILLEKGGVKYQIDYNL